ncbi:hypothetical protein AMATHDRAFT_146109 [Amanita thiersii Skay4041]|uniref:HAD-like protein n=1 Tax=Amanita thiersii Skay4041 TaxID=703135 RepID=A0A2A9NJ14_9AGAR|nr:hypothetical protein AMATHDRAFT_146109 [Amanita thiersii Skay4041]
MSPSNIKAVIFDIGGVVCRSPLIAIAAYEKEIGLPPNYLNCSIVERGHQGSWQRFERGEIPLLDFYEAFSRDLSDTHNGNKWYARYCERKGIDCPLLPESLKVDGRELFGRMMRESKELDTHIRDAITHIREAGKHKIIALTNNYARVDVPPSELAFLGWEEGGATPEHLTGLFDDFCDSSRFGMRKPEHGFYLLACDRNGIKPKEAVFLDDIGINLKAASELGMKTIRVEIGGSLKAVRQLEAIIGINLTAPGLTMDNPAKL